MHHNNNPWKEAFKQWLPLAVAILILAGLVYAVVQQNYRQSADDPQIQIAQDIANAIAQGGTPPDAIVPATPNQELGSSLATFVAIFDDSGKPLGSSVSIDGKLPTPPSGVFDFVRKNGQDKFTWQPNKGTRIAAVVTRYSGQASGFVLAGRSIREIEARENWLLIMSAAAALAALVLSYALMIFPAVLIHRRSRKEEAKAEGEEKESKSEEHHNPHHQS